MAGFTKLFSSILDSTIWQEPNETRLLWITMLAMSDANGEIQSSIPGLARRAAITLEQCEKGLITLSSPDTYSRTKDHEGRRIEEVTGGWRLLNHGRYRALLSYEERKEYNRIKQAERRAKLNCVNDMSNNVNESKQCQHITDNRVQITDTEASIKNKTNPTVSANTDDAGLFELEKLWLTFPPTSRNRSSRKKVSSAWRKTTRKPKMDDLIESVRKWAGCDQWTKDSGQYAPGAHIWINDRKWEDDPVPVSSHKHAGINQGGFTGEEF